MTAIICRRVLDEERGNEWICECPICSQVRKGEEDDQKIDKVDY